MSSTTPKNPSHRPVIAVLGAGTGIGEAVAQKFVAEGFTVALIARTEDKLQQMKDRIQQKYGQHTAEYYVTDLREEQQIITTFNLIKQELGPVHVMVYNAGARRVNGRMILNTGSDEFESFVKINLFGAFYATKCVLPDMLQIAAAQQQQYGQQASAAGTDHQAPSHALTQATALAAGDGQPGQRQVRSKLAAPTIIYTGATGSVRGSNGLSSFSPGKFGLRSLSQIATREYQAEGIHVAHVLVDAPVDGVLIGGVRRRQWQREGKTDVLADIEANLLQPHDLADSYWFLHRQPRSTWTQELDVRPQREGMFSKL